VEIDSIYLDYGVYHDSKKRMKYSVEGQMYLSPGQKHPINVAISWPQVDLTTLLEEIYG